MGPTVLIVDDDVDLATLLAHVFGLEGYEATVTHNARGALGIFGKEAPDLVVVDYYLPDMNGLDLCKRIRLQDKVPIIMVTTRSEEANVVQSLEEGVDDYVVKPFRPRELLARTKAVLRRAGMTPSAPESRVITAGEIRIDLRTREVRVGGNVVALTPTEFRLLHYLAENPGQVLTFDQIIQRVWGFDALGNEELVRVHVSRLRRKIRSSADDQGVIVNYPGVGYRLESN